ncbi:Multimodular transpeptidase-transglycosylase [Vulgatibacter incomptus]|uniref:Penicillin-binding protein 1A n=2 Tax=Vulgatibacter incomptus TaxID=1391653 RepID=A0A0K1PEF3_9BACT|nr:Multimodular transpeptidase-transglycosylase [Vulgatibacter incomptus]
MGPTRPQGESSAPEPAPSAKSKKTKKKAGLLRWLVRLTLAGFFLVLVAGAGAAYWGYREYGRDVPPVPRLDQWHPPILSEAFATDEVLIAEFFKERRKVVSYERIPKKLIQAFIAAEDGKFFDHPGFDVEGIAGAAFKMVTSGRVRGGGSTLTQQTAKALLISAEGYEKGREKTIRRKVKELLLALELEEKFSKEEILWLYLNNVYLGHHSYGVQSAAENYFRKNVEDLTLPEMALIAGLPQAPSRYSPFVYPERAAERRKYVLRRMFEEGMISQAQRDEAQAQPVKVHHVEDVFGDTAPFFAEHVRRDVVDRYGNQRMLNEGLKIWSSMNSENQRFAQNAMLKGLHFVDHRQGYYGPLDNVPKAEWPKRFAGFDEVLDKRGGAKLERDRLYVGIVTEVGPKLATVKLGTKLTAELPLAAARWARKPNSEAYFPSALISSLKDALSVGDLLIVRGSTWRDIGMDSEQPALKKTYGADGLFLALEQEPKLQGATVSLDPWSGYVVAMIGGYDFDASEFNRAFQSCRQPGSAFKPIVYSGNLELGKDTTDPTKTRPFTAASILIDAPIVADDPANQNRWKPQNYGLDFQGEVTAAHALVNSMNVPAVKALENLGVRATVDWANKIGITSKLNEDFSIALGSSCVTLWDLAKVYSTFDRLGTKPRTTFLRRVEDRFGRTLEDHTWYADGWAPLGDRILAGYAELGYEPERLITPETAYITTELLHQVTLFGTAARSGYLNNKWPIAGKTGTTNDSFDAWFMGFSRDLVAGVWVGYDRYDSSPMGRYENGGRAALPIWTEYMENALDGRPGRNWPVPAGISFASVDVRSGRPASGPGARVLPFKVGTAPTKESSHSGGTVDPDLFMMEH